VSTGAPRDAVDAALRIAGALETFAIPYAIGGALAYGFWAVPRATVDVDVNVFVEAGELANVFDALASVGVRLNAESARAAAARDGMFVGRLGGFRIDVFTPSIPFSREAERTRVRLSLAGQEVWFLSAEAIAVFKLLFFRGKDLVDLERLVATCRTLDVAGVRAHVVEMMGEDDERVTRWDELVAAHRRAP
jgi:hypothetical protein